MEDAKQIKKIDQSLSAKKLIKTPAVVLVKEKTSTEQIYKQKEEPPIQPEQPDADNRV